MSKIIVVSTRPPTAPLSGGMAPAVARACEEFDDVVWHALGTIATKDFQSAAENKPNPGDVKVSNVGRILVKQTIVEANKWDEHYNKFSNSYIWPLCHDRFDLAITPQTDDYNGNFYVNMQMAKAIAEDLKGDTKTPIWIHDYHHFSLAACLRSLGVTNPISFFNHIPLPDPKRIESLNPKVKAQFLMNLEGLSACDAINFQTQETARRYMELSGVENPPLLKAYERQKVSIPINGHHCEVMVGHYPISIDAAKVERNAIGDLESQDAKDLAAQMTAPYIFINFERCDYSKGIIPRLLAFEQLLDSRPDLAGKVQIVIGAEPTRPDIEEYKKYAADAVEIINRINEKTEWYHDNRPPVLLLPKQIPNGDVVKLMRQSHEGQRKIGTVTPYRDGMNLVAKEFMSAQDPDNSGVLILSKGAGAAAELALDGKGAIVYDPNDTNYEENIDAISAPIQRAMVQAIEMTQDEANIRCRALQKFIKENDLVKWSQENGQLLEDLGSYQSPVPTPGSSTPPSPSPF